VFENMAEIIQMKPEEPRLTTSGKNIIQDFREIDSFSWERMNEINERIAAAEAVLSSLHDEKEIFEKINFDDSKFKGILARSSRTWTVSEIYHCWLDYTQPERDREARENAIWDSTRRKSDKLKHFVLLNSKNNKIHLLAPSMEAARYIAFQNDRITSPLNGKFLKPTVSGTIANAIESAIADGWPGEIQIIGDHILHKRENKIY
jgi:hypothetical protein